MKRFRRMASSFGLALSVWMIVADFAEAAVLGWNNAAGGFAGTAANWNPAQVPAAADFLNFGLNNTYTVTFGVVVPASDHLGIDAGDVTFRFPTAHTNSTVLGIAQNGLSGDLVIESGSLTLLQNLFIAASAGHTGSLTVTGANTALIASSGAGSTVIGDQGAGTINIVDGASMTVANSPEFGDRAGGTGTLIVGGVSATSPFPRSRLTVNNSSTDPMELGSNGTGTGGILLGAQMDVSGTLQLGKNPGGVGTLVVSGTGGSDSARVNVGGDLKIARNDVGGTAAGSGTYNVGSGGVTDVAGDTYTFDPDGSTGQLEIREGGRFETGGLFVGAPATELDFTGGRLQVRGGSLDLNNQPLVLNSATGTPTLELHDNAQAVISSAAAPALNVGENAAGAFKVLHGSDLTVHDFNAVVGDDAGGNGTLTLDHAGSSLTVDQTLLVGRSGTGVFDARGGSQTTVNALGIATQPSGNGTANIRDAGTTVHVTDVFELAGLSGGPSMAPGVVNLSDDADLFLDRPLFSGNVWETGTLNIQSGAELHLNSTLMNRGLISLSGGSISGGLLGPTNGGRIQGTGVAFSTIFATFDTTGLITPVGGPLTLGTTATPVGFNFLGRIDVPLQDVTLVDPDSAVVGTVILSGGRLIGPAGGIHLSLDRRITGTGTIMGAIRPVGRILPTGAAGISFTGPVLGVGQGMNGSRFRFQPGSSFLGFGRIEASIQVDTGAVILPINDLTLGSAPLASSVTIDGRLAVGPGVEVDLNGTDSTRVTGAITLAQGFVTSSTSPLVTRPQARITGNGSLPATFNAGTIEPGPGVNDLHFAGLNMRNTSKIEFEVGNYSAGEMDSISSAAQVLISGTLDIRTLSGYAPVVGDSFLVLSYPARAGSFSSVTLNGGPAAPQIQLTYRPTGTYAKIIGIVAVNDPTAAARSVQLSSLGSPSRVLAFALELPEAADVDVELFDVSGRRVATLHDGALSAGRHRFEAGASLGGAGIYLARATVRGSHETVVRTVRSVRIR